jgi:nucleoside 2-deoxyribosyltransferase
MSNCFTIQPFDRDKFDRRFSDVFEPAIEATGLRAYRVDRDPSVRIPIEDIEKNIRESELCFAEITTNNPNVWYELGYAFAYGKDVIMVCCSDERKESFPFDVRHKHIIEYKSTSPSDFVSLSQRITEKIDAYLSSSKLVANIATSPVVSTEGLNFQELSILIIVLENQPTDHDKLNVNNLVEQMMKAGFTKAATNVALRTLQIKKLLDFTQVEEYYYNETYLATYCFLTSSGVEWLINNQDKIRVRLDVSELSRPTSPDQRSDEDDLPF